MRLKLLSTSQLEASHTADNLSKALKGITDFWECTQKVHSCLSDSASNINKAICLNKWDHLSCLTHTCTLTCNLIVTASIYKDPEVVDLIQKIKNIVSFFQDYPKAMDNLRVNQNCLNLRNHKFIHAGTALHDGKIPGTA